MRFDLISKSLVNIIPINRKKIQLIKIYIILAPPTQPSGTIYTKLGGIPTESGCEFPDTYAKEFKQYADCGSPVFGGLRVSTKFVYVHQLLMAKSISVLGEKIFSWTQ